MGFLVPQVPNITKITCVSDVVHYAVFGTDKNTKWKTHFRHL